MSLALFAPVLEWVQELRIKPCQASQILGIDLICLTLVGVDENPTCPRRVGSGLDGYARRGCSESKRRLKASGLVRAAYSLRSPRRFVSR
jgi:hypothetical protein